MTPIQAIAALFWTALVASALALVFDRHLRESLNSHWKVLAFLLLVTALWRAPSGAIFFHGLEYEDSYVYTVAGRQLAERTELPATEQEFPFSVSVCTVGSLRDCSVWETNPEHLLGYPYVIGLFSRVFGYTPSAGSIINLLASFPSVLLIFSITLLITGDSTASVAAALAFAIIPVFAVYGLETSAEPFSNFCILLTIWLYLRFVDSNSTTLLGSASLWLAYTMTLLLAETVKREDFLLALLMPAMIPLVFSEKRVRAEARSNTVGLILLSSGLALLLAYKMHLLQTSENERELLRQFPFTVHRFVTFVGGFLASFLALRWYGGTLVLIAAGIAAACLRRGRAFLPLVLLTAFILLYASHIRSYYEMESGHIVPDASLRFSMNFMGLWAITTGSGVGLIGDKLKAIRANQTLRCVYKWGSVVVLVGVLGISFIATRQLRGNELEDEAINRVTPL